MKIINFRTEYYRVFGILVEECGNIEWQCIPPTATQVRVRMVPGV